LLLFLFENNPLNIYKAIYILRSNMITQKDKIQVIFISKPRWEAGWPYLGFDNDNLINKLKSNLIQNFHDIEFLWSEDIVTTYNVNLVESIKKSIGSANGIIIFTIGHYGDPGIVQAGIEFIESNKPAILANYIYGGDHTFTKIYTSVKNKHHNILPISSQKIEDFNKAIRIMKNLLNLRNKKILVYASDIVKMNLQVILELFNPERKSIIKNYPEFLNQVGIISNNSEFEFYTDTKGLDQAHQWRQDEEKYKNLLMQTFGIEMIRGDPKEILQYYNQVDEKKAKEVSDKWIKHALKVEPNEESILNAAKLYLAFKIILEEREINFFTPDCGTFLLSGILPAYPCLPFFELSNEGMYGICESDMDSAISYLFGLSITGRPGFVSNHTFNTTKDQMTYMHCVAPNRLYGIDREAAPYEIVYHGETHFLGASPCVKFPLGETVTTIKISNFNKKISIRTGEIIDNPTNEGGCVTKVLVKSSKPVIELLDDYDWDSFGWHRVTFVGNWKEEFIMGAKLLGLDIIDESK
jgi:hypothetical protein